MSSYARGNSVRALAATGALFGTLFVLSGRARAEAGALTQSPGSDGCISQDGGEPCTVADLLEGAFSVSVTRDGKNAYAALIEADAIAVLARDKQTGGLSPLPSPLGCVSDDGSGGLCTDGKALFDPYAVATSPDGRNVYVVSHQRDPVTITAVAIFARDKASGALTQLPDVQGCLSEDGTGGLCTDVDVLRGVRSVAVSRDGRHVYVASEGSDAVAVFSRDKQSGALTFKSCNSQDGSGGLCADDEALDGAQAVVVSNDGRHVYVASERSRAVAAFARDKKTGVLTQLPGMAGCISEDGSGGACADGVGLASPIALAVSPKGRQAYVASNFGDVLAVLARDKKTGALTQLPPPQGCISEDGTGGLCADGHSLDWLGSVAVSPDGKHVYAASRDDDAVSVFAQDKVTGVLSQLPDPAGCVSEDGSSGLCADGRALDGARSVTLSKDGKHVYVASQGSDAIAVLERQK